MQNLEGNKWYRGRERLFVAVDCVIFGFDQGVLKLLVFKRAVEPLKGEWSLIGSFIQEEENANEAAKRVLKEITGLDDIFMEELKTYSKVDRDPGARCVSISQYALIKIEEYDKELVEQHGAFWFAVDSLPSLVLDHNQMVVDALEHLRHKVQFYPIGFELLPHRFTIPQLQSLYEEIFQKKLDTRNFRKKFFSLDLLNKTTEKDKSSSKKGAYLYQFDLKKYNTLQQSGFNFLLLKK
ncbi:NUDIX domain-containing protein [Aquimarina sp. AU474]|uniref:NUDIX hydrolase n=1 Tax=Aquimarina sp. AU474 TaxID=2108529 RepID=UPI000D68825D|nr:NUDIX domain-containing protein [Aquimarina sp. AU474]